VKNPDRYAAAICIRVRPDCLFRGYSVDEICACPYCEGHNGPQTLSGTLRGFPGVYFFFLFDVFFAVFFAAFAVFFAFFAFLAMLSSVIP
jgi:hypothetical protein